MIISYLTDRLGNQLFQYAAAKALAVENNTVAKMSKRYYERDAPAGFEYELNNYCIPQNFATKEELDEYTWKNDSLLYRAIRQVYPKYTYFEKSFGYDENFKKLGDKVCLRGFWQSYKYFDHIEDIIRQEFAFKYPVDLTNDLFAKDIHESESVCISIRRGDHITNPKIGNFFGKCSNDYYKNGISLINQKYNNIKLFVFSDDIEWCRKNLAFDHPMVFVEHGFKESRFDYYLQLMSMCKHFVIPVSTFPWWGAWLSTNKNKIVIYPKTWFNDASINTNDLCPPSWIKIPNG